MTRRNYSLLEGVLYNMAVGLHCIQPRGICWHRSVFGESQAGLRLSAQAMGRKRREAIRGQYVAIPFVPILTDGFTQRGDRDKPSPNKRRHQEERVDRYGDHAVGAAQSPVRRSNSAPIDKLIGMIKEKSAPFIENNEVITFLWQHIRHYFEQQNAGI